MKIGRILLTVLALGIIFGTPGFADERTVHDGTDEYIVYTFTGVVSSTAITNDHNYDWRVGSILYYIPGGNMTNTFTYDHVRVLSTNQYLGDVVTTNVFGEVETNTYHTITNTVFTKITNRLFTAVTTNVNSHSYQEVADWIAYDYIIPSDELVFTFSPATNKPMLIINGINP